MKPTSTESLPLSEVQSTKVDYTLLLPGYLRKFTKSKYPKSITLLCMKYTKIKDITPENDDVNFITSNDIKECDYYKKLGNNLFKSKNYYNAIAYYSKSLQYNPNNHFVLCNLSLCHYFLKEYDDALTYAKLYLQSDPTFAKGWYRYGSILEKQQKYGKAGVAYKAAHNISIDWSNNNSTNNYSKNYSKYLKRVNNLKDSKSIISFIDNYETNIVKESKNSQQNMINSLMKHMGSKNPQEMLQNFDFNDIMNVLENDKTLSEQTENESIYSLIEESKYNYYLNNNKLQFYRDNNNEFVGWTLSWSSSPPINFNKRMYNIMIAGGGLAVAQYTCYGLPSVDRYINYLKRAMSFCNGTKLSCKKPINLLIDYRTINRGYFDTIEKHMKLLGIKCIKESYQDSKQVCDGNNTSVYGWNHLD